SLIRRLKKKNIRVVLQDRNDSCPGRQLADEFVPLDTCDSRGAADTAGRFKVDSVLTTGTDQPVLAASIAAEKRGCPSFINTDTALALTDKEVMKSLLKKAEIRLPEYRIAGPLDGQEVIKGLKLPLVVKPVDSQGQRGVVKLETPEDFLKYRDSSLQWSRRKKLIVEEYHPNREITVSGWVFQGETLIWTVTDRVTRDFSPHIGLCLAHRYPSVYAAFRQLEIAEISRNCVKALGIKNGPIYFQFLITASEILVNETAGRLGGAYEDISLPPVCGNDLIEILIAGSLKGSANPKEIEYRVPISAKAFTVPLMFCREGRISETAGDNPVCGFPGVTSFRYLLKKGTDIGPLTNSVQRAAYLVIHGKGPMEVNRTLKNVWPRIKITDRTGRQLLRNTIGYALNENI
ncbi:MAG: ATP-grasp domain-containing protein, partial [Spirochaetaceae bacterium]|nr:ATP-grasp domain-containing protein [Spirochaetaceae bacterium]